MDRFTRSTYEEIQEKIAQKEKELAELKTLFPKLGYLRNIRGYLEKGLPYEELYRVEKQALENVFKPQYFKRLKVKK